MASRPPSPAFTKKKHKMFTRNNIQRVVWNVRDIDWLVRLLGVPERRWREIERQFRGDRQRQLKECINYFIDHNHLASWRCVIVALDYMGDKEAAEKIRHLAEPVTDPTLTINNLQQVTASVQGWRSLGDYFFGLSVPRAVREEISGNPAYQTEEERKTAVLLYFLQYVPMASWQTVAGALHRMEEERALQAVKQFLTVSPEASLTPENLSAVLDIMSDGQWEKFGRYINTPESELQRIRQCTSDRECKQALIDSFISSHPAPSWTLVAHALNLMGRWEESCLRALDLLQQLFPTGRYRSRQIYEQEMKRGHFLLDLDKQLLFGIAGSGKSSVLALLLGEIPPTIRHSTQLLRSPIEIRFVVVDGETKWQIFAPSGMRDTVAEIIKSRMPQEQTAAESSGSPASPDQQSTHTTTSQSSQPTPDSSKSRKLKQKIKARLRDLFTRMFHRAREQPVAEAGISTSEQPVAEGSLESLLQASEVDEEFVALINSAPPSSEPILRLRMFVVLDSGGQPEFLEMMPVFLNGASKFVYVFKVNESLDERPTIRYFKDGRLVWEYPASMTNEATLRLCVRTMSSLSNKNPDMPGAKMMFLATHRDKVAEGQLPRVLDTLHERLREILLPRFREQLIYCDTMGEEFVFTLNAAEPGEEDRECVESIRACLSELGEGRKEVKVPLRWQALYQKLLEVVGGLGKKVLPRDLCQQVADSMEMDEESCGEALKFFHGLNILFYFPDILPQMVFMKPQMLLDKVSELVDETYNMRNGEKGRPMSGERLRFRDYAQVTEEFLAEFESNYEAPLFTAKELVTLLKGLLVFAEMSEGVYLMPCLLRVVEGEVVEEHRVSGSKVLALHFPYSGPLIGMFCSTVAYLLSPENPRPWRVVQNQAGAPECLHRNLIKFTIPGCVGGVTLIDHFTHFELHVNTHPKKAAELWGLARNAVFAGLEKAGKTIGYTNYTPVSAVICPAHHPHPAKTHPATVEDGVWACSIDSEKFGDLAEGSIPWMTVCPTHSAESAIPYPSSSSSAVPSTSRPSLSVSSAPPTTTLTPPTTTTAESSNASSDTLSAPPLSMSSPPLSSTPTPSPASTAPSSSSTSPLPTSGGGQPTLPELLRLKVPQEVGANYITFGVLLLNDTTGCRVDAMENMYCRDGERICRRILQEWLAGKGLPVDWQTLITTLRDSDLSTLADRVQAAKL